MFGLDTGLLILLIVCLLCACLFEFINGFHDTANAVATVIYTKSLNPTQAVVWSGVWNFLGVLSTLIWGIAVATGITDLLPVETLTDPNIYHNIGMILSLLLTAIFWNLITWYLGIPCSSSHTLIGSILGVAFGYALLHPGSGVESVVNWKKASDIGLTLLISPFFGFSLAVFIMFAMRRMLTKKHIIFKEPDVSGKPPFWIRFILILTCTSVSFSHGSNDGQKGIGLVMIILISIVPVHFALNPKYDGTYLGKHTQEISGIINNINSSKLSRPDDVLQLNSIKGSLTELEALSTTLNDKKDSGQFQVRKHILLASKSIERLLKHGNANLSDNDKKALNSEIKSLRAMTDHVPLWVLVMISVALGLGTMIGWKRIVVTIGEKIGKQHLTYAQGASAELAAATLIQISTQLGGLVSTTHVLSSGIAGSMVASKGIKNLQAKTIRNILIAWVLTLPVCMLVSGLMFWLFSIIL